MTRPARHASRPCAAEGAAAQQQRQWQSQRGWLRGRCPLLPAAATAVDVVINNAGVFSKGNFLDTPVEVCWVLGGCTAACCLFFCCCGCSWACFVGVALQLVCVLLVCVLLWLPLCLASQGLPLHETSLVAASELWRDETRLPAPPPSGLAACRRPAA